MSVKTFFEARERGRVLPFLHYLEDRLGVLEDNAMWEKYKKYPTEKFQQ